MFKGLNEAVGRCSGLFSCYSDWMLCFSELQDTFEIQTAFPLIGHIMTTFCDPDYEVVSDVYPFFDHIYQFDIDQLYTFHILTNLLFGEWIICGCLGSGKSYLAYIVILMACIDLINIDNLIIAITEELPL